MKTLVWVATLLFATGVSAQISDRAADREVARRFGEAVAKAFNDRDEKAVSQLLDLRGLALRAGKVQDMEGPTLEKFAEGFVDAAGPTMADGYFKKLDQTNGTAVFLRVTDTRPGRPLVRLDLGTGGNDYMEFVLETREGRTRAVDWFQLSTGELLSVTAGGIGQIFTTSDRGLLSRLLGTERVDAGAMEHLKRAGQLQRAGKYDAALVEMQRLPEPIQDARVILVFQATMSLMAKKDDEYTRILSKLARLHGDNPATAFMLLDHYFTIKDLPNMLRSLDTMEKRVGIDGITRNFRASAYFSVGDYANTLKYADEAIRVEPTLMAGHDTRGSALVGLARYADAVAQYRDLAERFDVEFSRDAFTADPFFAKFAASPEFRAWLPQ